MRKLPPLATLRAFEAAARHLSFKRAARELAVTPTAISHHIRQLETALGTKLFERHTRRVVLTPAGQALYPTLSNSFDAMAKALAAVRAKKSERVVTLTATMTFASRWLVPRIPAFRARFPDIRLRILAWDDVVDLRTGAADIAVRYGGGEYPGCRSQLLLRGQYAPVCSPRLQVKTPRDLTRHTLIHFEWRHTGDDTPSWPRWFTAANQPCLGQTAEIAFSDETHALQAAISGQGVALACLALVADELASGVLACPFGPILGAQGFHVVIPDRLAHDEQIEVVRHWLTEEADAANSRNKAAAAASKTDRA
jgi:LysR family transcriptional regulator, glycine cleavage system transcriptional activator